MKDVFTSKGSLSGSIHDFYQEQFSQKRNFKQCKKKKTLLYVGVAPFLGTPSPSVCVRGESYGRESCSEDGNNDNMIYIDQVRRSMEERS